MKAKKKTDWPWRQDQAEHMAMRQVQNRGKGKTKAESWVANLLKQKIEMKWTFQSCWGFRLFDFWNHQLGIAIEVDGPEHNKALDEWRDAKEWTRSRIKIFRVRNFDESDAELVIAKIKVEPGWNVRRVAANMAPIKGADWRPK